MIVPLILQHFKYLSEVQLGQIQFSVRVSFFNKVAHLSSPLILGKIIIIMVFDIN